MNIMLRNALNILKEYEGLRHQVEKNLIGKDGERWARELQKFLRKEPCWTILPREKTDVLTIDRQPFNPVKFISEGWSIEEEDGHSLRLAEIDITAVRFEHMLKKDEEVIKGEEKLQRLKDAGHIRLDAKVFETLWNNQHLIPEKWKEKTNGNTTHIFFDGTILRNSHGRRYVLFLCWRDGDWRWDCRWLGHEWHACHPSAVLSS